MSKYTEAWNNAINLFDSIGELAFNLLLVIAITLLICLGVYVAVRIITYIYCVYQSRKQKSELN